MKVRDYLMKTNPKLPYTTSAELGYSKLIKSPRVQCACNHCSKKLPTKKPRIDIHTCHPETTLWETQTICIDCYLKCIYHRLETEDPSKIFHLRNLSTTSLIAANEADTQLSMDIPLLTQAKNRLKTKYETSYGDTFDDFELAVTSEYKRLCAELIVMRDVNGKAVDNFTNAAAIYAPDTVGIKALTYKIATCDEPINKEALLSCIYKHAIGSGDLLILYDSTSMKYIGLNATMLRDIINTKTAEFTL